MQIPLSVRVDFGPIGGTAADPHRVRAENGNDYLMKGGTFAGHQYAALNEWVAAEFCQMLGYPIMSHRLLELGGTVYFGSEWMEPTTYGNSWPPQVLRSCVNSALLYDVFAFDTWICNVDRHHGNLLVREDPDKVKSLLLNDHDRCLLSPGVAPASISVQMALMPHQCTRLLFIATEMTSASELGRAIGKIQQISKSDIVSVVQAIPIQWLAQNDRRLLVDFLSLRKEQLKTLFENARAHYPHLIGTL